MKKLLYKIKLPLIILLTLVLLGLVGISQKKETPTVEKPTVEQEEIRHKDFYLEIPKINIAAPIVADVNGNDKEGYFKALEEGVAHYEGTAKPGEGSNIFIFGHSSYYFWKPGDYKDVFKGLNKLENNDEILVWNSSKEYKYTVIDKKIIQPSEVNVLNPTKSEQLTLMTCWPVGTTKERLIVIAKPM